MTISATIWFACAAIAVSAAATLVSPPATAATAVREPGGVIRYYDDNGNDRGYAWCARQGGRDFGSWLDCSYFNHQQCRAGLFYPPGGDCFPNPFAQFVTPGPARPRRR